MSQVNTNAIYDASGGSAAVLYGVASPPNSMGFRNRIINGSMVIDQRNAGASGTANTYTVDRWNYFGTQASKATWQQNAGSLSAANRPAGFTNYFGITSSSAYPVLTGDTFLFVQPIEGLNIADFGWGSSGAQTITLSFWVRSSLTGTFGGALTNGATNRSYLFSYAISTANTWENKTVTIAGDTTGTWATDNSVGVYVRFGLGSGATYSGTSGSWQAGNLVQPTGTVSVVGTNGATFYITGVQLEAGTVASPFERRDYGRELMLCQRYYTQLSGNVNIGTACQSSTTTTLGYIPLPVTMRGGSPTVLFGSGFATTDTYSYNTPASITGVTLVQNGVSVAASTAAVGATGRATLYLINGGSIGFQSEL